MFVIQYSPGKILEVTHAGMLYLDNHRDAHYLDFAQCGRRWLAHARSRGVTGLHPSKNNCIGQRNAGARPPYILLFDIRPVRFEFRNPGQSWELEYALRCAGWSTSDMM